MCDGPREERVILERQGTVEVTKEVQYTIYLHNIYRVQTLEGGDYGLQKLFGTFGAIIWGPISGKVIGKTLRMDMSDNIYIHEYLKDV